MPQSRTFWTDNVVPVAALTRDVDGEEALLGVSVAGQQGFYSASGGLQNRRQLATPAVHNNRWLLSPAPATYVIAGVVRARATFSRISTNSFNGAGFTNALGDIVLNYVPSANRDPEEYESALYARPRVIRQLADLPAPPNIAAITGTNRVRSTYSEFLGGFIQTQLTVTPAAYADPEVLPHPPTVVQNLPFAVAAPPNPPPVIPTGQRSVDEGARPTKVVQNLTFSPAPAPPPVAAGPRGTDEGPRPPKTVQNLSFTPAPTPPPFAIGPRGFDEGARPEKVIQALTFSPAPTPPPFTIGLRGFDAGARPETVIQSPLGAAPPPNPPPVIVYGLRSFDEGGRPKKVVQNLTFSPAPTPPPFADNVIPAEVLRHGPSIIPFKPAVVLPFQILPDQAHGGSGPEEASGGYGLGAFSGGSGTEDTSGSVTVGAGSGASGPDS